MKGLKFPARFGVVVYEEDLNRDSEGYEFLTKFGIEEVKKIYLKVAKTGTGRDVRCPGTFEEGVRLSNLIDEFEEGFKERVGSRLPYVDIAAWAFHFFTNRQPLKNCNHRTALGIADQILGAFGKKLEQETNDELMRTLEGFEKWCASENEIREWITQNLSAI